MANKPKLGVRIKEERVTVDKTGKEIRREVVRDDGPDRSYEADDATRKRMLKARLAEREPKGLYTKPEPAKPELATMTLNPARNLRERKAKLDKAIADSGG
jgi:hypothetical protein